LRTLGLTIALLIAASGWAEAADVHPVSFNVSVIDQDNLPVAQAVVEVRADGQVLATSTTSEAGRTSVTVPGPGSYILQVSKKTYIASQTKLEVGAQTAQVDVVLNSVALSKQQIEVHGAASSPITEPSSIQSTLSTVAAKASPSRPATLKDALPLVPGVVRARDGSVSIGGFTENHSALLVNSVNVTDPVSGEFGLSVPIDSVESISVAEVPYLAQYGRFTAGVVTAETRRGGDQWNYSLNDPLPDFRIRSGHLEGIRDASPRVNLSGPIIANRLYFLEGGEYLLNKQPVRTLPFPANEMRSEAINSFTQMDYIISPTQTLTGSFHFAPHSVDHFGLDFFNPQPVTPDATFHDSTATLLHRFAIGGGVLQSTVAKTRVSTAIQPLGDENMVLSPLGNSGNYFNLESRLATRFQWIESWTPRELHFHGNHILQIGSVVSQSENQGRVRARPFTIQDAGGHVLQQVDFTAGKAISLTDTEPAVYAQDHWMFGDHFALDTGLRIEAQTITSTVRSAPRAGFVWTPDRAAKNIIRGGVGVFYDSVALNLYKFKRYPEQIVTSFDGAGNVIDGPTHFINLTDEATASHFPFVHRALKIGNFAPYNVAWNVEFERSLNRLVMLRLKYLQSHAEDMITIHPQLVQGVNTFVLGSSGTARTRQFEFTARAGTSERRRFFFSYVRQYARGDINDGTGYLGNFPFPVVRQELIASLPGEIPNRFLLWGTYSLPRKIQVLPHLEYRNGFPYQPIDVLQQYVADVSGPQSRFPRYFSFDMRISKDFKMPHNHAIQLSTSILNLTNHFNPLEVHANTADPSFGNFFGNYHRRLLVDFDFLY
jgi:hypothetical protein